MTLRKPFQILFLWFVVLGVFYPALFAGVNSVDDWQMFVGLEQLARGNWLNFFLPPTGFYYRPLLMLTFRLDYLLWGQQAGFYHLENILLHGANATLVLALARSLQKREGGQAGNSWLPLVTALLFALHPIVTESVNWISGRTDLLGTFFVLAATLAILKGARELSIIPLLIAVPLLACAILSKEVMVFFLPAAGFLLWRFSPSQARSWRQRGLAIVLLPFAVLGTAFFGLRLARHGIDAGLDRLLHGYHYDLFNSFRVFFKVLGFYGKKMVAPLPLNFAIRQVNDQYVWLGLALAVVCLVLFFLRRRATDLLLISFYLVVPGILIALASVAWTPIAERYIYLPTAFFVLGGSFWVAGSIAGGARQTVVLTCAALLLFPMTLATARRNLVWQDQVALYADSLRKSPNFAAMNNELAIALMNNGQFDQAEKLLIEGKKKATASPLLYVNHARLLVEKGDLVGARKELMAICQEPANANLEALKMLARIDEQRLRGKGTVEEVGPELVTLYEAIESRSGKPVAAYRAGQLLLALGKRQQAAVCFNRAYERAPQDAYYREAAGKLARKLSAQEGR